MYNVLVEAEVLCNVAGMTLDDDFQPSIPVPGNRRPLALGDIWATESGRVFVVQKYSGHSMFKFLAVECSPRIPYPEKVPYFAELYDNFGCWSHWPGQTTSIDLIHFISGGNTK
jgi:hypothetical protein